MQSSPVPLHRVLRHLVLVLGILQPASLSYSVSFRPPEIYQGGNYDGKRYTFTGKIGHSNDCEESSFENKTTIASPLAKDCAMMAGKVLANSMVWSYDGISGCRSYQLMEGKFHDIVSYRSCVFGMRQDSTSMGTVNVGDIDIYQILTDALSKFSITTRFNETLAAASGTVDCQIMGEPYNTNTVRWDMKRASQFDAHHDFTVHTSCDGSH